MATLQECQAIDASQYVWTYGKKFKDKVNELSRREGTSSYIQMKGLDFLPYMAFTRADGTAWAELETLFQQEVLAHGVLASWLTVTYAHKPDHLDRTIEVFGHAMRGLKKLIENEMLERTLVGDPIKPVMRTYNKCRKRICGQLHPEAGLATCCKRDGE